LEDMRHKSISVLLLDDDINLIIKIIIVEELGHAIESKCASAV